MFWSLVFSAEGPKGVRHAALPALVQIVLVNDQACFQRCKHDMSDAVSHKTCLADTSLQDLGL